ncbi:hypothetical protein COL154_014030 [Colletotrichum chrysophilum]|nr:hypothetical protein COL154_014030 [Colletotrichum chrysophilum]
MEDNAGPDEEIVAVPSRHLTMRFDMIDDYKDLPEVTRQQIEHFFQHYKDLEAGKWARIGDWKDVESARSLIAEAIERYRGAAPPVPVRLLAGPVMKTLADPSFFRLIHALIDESHSDTRRTQWTHRGVEWSRVHHSFTGPLWGFGIHQYLLTGPAPRGWSLIVVRENWWSTVDDSVLRSTQWAKQLSGQRSHVWEWLHREENRLLIAPMKTEITP